MLLFGLSQKPPFVNDSHTPADVRDLWAVPPLQMQILPALCALILVAAAFFNPIDVSGSGEQQVSLSGQVAIKLAVAGLATGLGVWGLLSLSRVRRILGTFTGTILLTLGMVFVLTSAVAISEIANVARVASLIFLAYVLFTITSVVILGIDRVAVCVLIGCSLFLLGSWFAYLLVPSIGVYVEDLGTHTKINRMGGLAHPNVLGRMSMLTAILAISLYRQQPKYRVVLVTLALLALATAITAFSRTAILAGMVGLAVLLFDLLPTRRGLVVCLTICAVGLFGLVAIELATGSDLVGKVLLSASTKTGNVEELTSATGRTAIWAEALRLIQARPWTGYGLNSSPLLLTNFSQHTHNILLHPLLSGGLAAGLLMALLLALNLVFGIRSEQRLIRSVAAFVLFSGLFEDTLLDTFPSPLTVLWLLVTLYPSIALLSDRRQLPVEHPGLPGYTMA